MKRLVGFIKWLAVVFAVLVVLVTVHSAPPKEHIQIVPPEKVTFKAVPEAHFFGVDGNDMAGVGLMPMVRKVRCFKRYTERPIRFGAQEYSIKPAYFYASSQVDYWYCHNLQGRDWVRPYHMAVTILYVRNQCSPADRPLRGFLVDNYFRDHYRSSAGNYHKKMWMHCHNRGFSYRPKWLPRRSTPRLFNVKHYPPDAISHIKANYLHDDDGNGRKRLPFHWYSSKPDDGGGGILI